NSSDITITGLTLTGGVTDYSGYHLIGNPYPCSLLWDNTWAKTNLDATACIWDHTNGHYWYHNGITGNGPFANGIIPAEQAFYIKANADGGSITIPQAKRLHSTQTFYKKEEPVTLSLKLSGDDGYDESVIMFTQGSTVGFDHPFDCQKLWGNDAATEIFSWIDGTVPASINVLPDETNCPAIPIGIKVGNTGSYSIDVTGMGTFHDDIAIFLEDKLTGAMQNLRTNPGYTFNSSPQTPSDPNRFLVHFSPTGIGVMSGPSIRIFAIEKNVYVNISEKTQGTISIYNLLGEKIAEKDIAGNTKNIIPLDVTEGIYIVNIFANEFRKTGKVIIR
ncbi:MAG: T9SS type A sorting domain-containing protein, partial [Bacteroidetes bacterium]|nr:T9SS type A sorting domain-containing protein [Bacteroidota bacterium]